MYIVLIILAVIALVTVLWTFLHALPRKESVLHLFSGELKSGKTFMAVRDCLCFYRREMRRWKRGKTYRKPKIYSNIPVIIGYNWDYIIAHFIEWCQDVKNYKRETRRKTDLEKCKNTRLSKYYVWSDVLTRDMLILKEVIPEDVLPIWLYDDAGASASQYSYNDPNVITYNLNENYECLETNTRYYGHFYGGNRAKWRCTEQRFGGLCINIRSRMGSCDVLMNFRRLWGFLPLFKVDVDRLSTQDDTLLQNVKEVGRDGRRKSDYYTGFLPYKKFSVRHYDSECYEPAKYSGFVKTVPFSSWMDNPLGLKTNYCPDLRMTEEEKREMKRLTDEAEKRAMKGKINV